MIRYVIALTQLGIRNENIIKLLSDYSLDDISSMFNLSTDSNIFDNNFDLMSYYEIFSIKENVDTSLTKADEILSLNEELNIKTTCFNSPTYPKNLAAINNPPAIIYYKGAEFTSEFEIAIACVGTRKPTRLSYNAVNYLVPQWVNEGCAIMSGLACGVDKISHQACISAGGKTIAVLAHGLDTIYPKENTALGERILDSGGILMSEYPVGTKADKFRFVNRNRLIVGLSKAVVIYECDAKGGTMHNVEHADKQGKPIFCPALRDKVLDIQTGTKQLLDKKKATEIKEGRDFAKVITAIGYNLSKNKIPAVDIKLNYLKSILLIMHQSIVLDASLRDNNISIDSSDIKVIYVTLVNMIKSKQLNIDTFLSSMVENNISCIAKTLVFTD